MTFCPVEYSINAHLREEDAREAQLEAIRERAEEIVRDDIVAVLGELSQSEERKLYEALASICESDANFIAAGRVVRSVLMGAAREMARRRLDEEDKMGW